MKFNDSDLQLALHSLKVEGEELVAVKCLTYRYNAARGEYVCTKGMGLYRSPKLVYYVRAVKLRPKGEFDWALIAKIPLRAVRFVEEYAAKSGDIDLLIYYLSDRGYITPIGMNLPTYYVEAAARMLLELAKAAAGEGQ